MSLSRWYETLRRLTPGQVFYRLWLPLKKRMIADASVPPTAILAARSFPANNFPALPVRNTMRSDAGTFALLNKTVAFKHGADWNYRGEGLLWAYHLNYFEWLYDERIPPVRRMDTIRDYVAQSAGLRIGRDSYPASLRAMHWIWFFGKEKIAEDAALMLLYRHCSRLARLPERHLLGNHLLMNGLALFHAAHFFGDGNFYRISSAILKQELAEQILPDGAHFERSVSYHSQLLFYLLSAIQAAACTHRFKEAALLLQLRKSAALMLAWFGEMTTGDGFPAFGDANPETGVPYSFLTETALGLGIVPAEIRGYKREHGSGYKTLLCGGLKLIINAGSPPAYQPGHSHADPLSFVLYKDARPVIVDTGASTYEPGRRRTAERSTSAHNTVSINRLNASDVWRSFRMGRRAIISVLSDKHDELSAKHNGYRRSGIIHYRTCRCENRKIILTDELEGFTTQAAVFKLHFHPDISVKQIDKQTFTAGPLLFFAEGLFDVHLQPYEFAEGFNKIKTAFCLTAGMNKQATVVFEPLATEC